VALSLVVPLVLLVSAAFGLVYSCQAYNLPTLDNTCKNEEIINTESNENTKWWS